MHLIKLDEQLEHRVLNTLNLLSYKLSNQLNQIASGLFMPAWAVGTTCANLWEGGIFSYQFE